MVTNPPEPCASCLTPLALHCKLHKPRCCPGTCSGPTPIKVRCKVYQRGTKLYLVGASLLNERGEMELVAISEDESIRAKISATEYNRLPWYWFQMEEKTNARKPRWVPLG